MTYYSHCSDGPKAQWHTFAEHAQGTADRAARFLSPFRLAKMARACGLLHDLGMLSRDFQAILEGSGQRFDHSAAGAKTALERYGRPGRILAPAITAHHTGLQDWSTTEERIRRAGSPDPGWEKLVDLPKSLIDGRTARRFNDAFACQLLIRMIFSASVDADYLDAEAYEDRVEDRPSKRGGQPPLPELRDRLWSHIRSLSGGTDMGWLRKDVLEHATDASGKPQGMFTLTAPPGAGKTLSALAFALQHALQHGLDRVIHATPMPLASSRTAARLRLALEDANAVIEDQGAVDDTGSRQEGPRRRPEGPVQNWDWPLVCTTTEQLTRNLYSNRPGDCRKLHNIASSVVIIDDADRLPLPSLQPTVAALRELARTWRASILICGDAPRSLAAADGFQDGFEDVRELAPDLDGLHRRAGARCTVDVADIVANRQTTDTELVNLLTSHHQVLCIVNTPGHARKLQDRLDAPSTLRLSCEMTRTAQSEVVGKARTMLRNGSPVKLIATRVAETVELDFPAVYRALAAVYSLIRAAGRCNREGEGGTGALVVFEPETTPESEPPADVDQQAGWARNALRRAQDDPLGPESARDYWKTTCWAAGDTFDSRQILRKIAERGSRLEFPFEEIGKDIRRAL